MNRQTSNNMVDEHVERFRRRTILAVLFLLVVVIPVLGWFGIIEPTSVNKLGRYLCFAIVALGIDLLWGYTGLLGLCQALFFCLGGYAVAMHLSLPQGGGDVRPEYHNIPQFFFFNNVNVLPSWWEPFSSLPFALGAAVSVPLVVATVFGFIVFRSGIKGVYFAIMTQALAWGAFLLFCRNELLLGGTNGLTNFNPAMNRDLQWILGLYLLTVLALVLLFAIARGITRSRSGRLLVAVRDKEVLLGFMGYRPWTIKLFAFAVGAVFAAIGGVLYVPQNGIITPNVMRVEDSIWMIIWVALGGRGRLWGSVCGALLVNYAYSIMTSDMPRAWPFFQGGMFVAVVLFFPGGLVRLWDKFEQDIGAGAWTWGPVAAMLVGFAVLLADKAGWLVWVPYSLSYAVAAAGMVLLAIRRPSRSGLILGAVTLFMVSEALGIVPLELESALFGVPIKYLLLFGVLAAVGVSFAVPLLARLSGTIPQTAHEPR